MRWKFHIPSLARHYISGAAGQAEAEAAHDVAEDRADERAAAGANGRGDDVTLDVVFFLNDLAFLHFHVFAALAVGLPPGLFDFDDAHLDRNQAAIDFDGTEREIQVGLATKSGKVPGLLDCANDAVDAGACGKHQLTAEIDGLGHNGNERVPSLATAVLMPLKSVR